MGQKRTTVSLGLIVALSTFLFTSSVLAQDAAPSPIEEGKKIAFDRQKGNCLACHAIAGGTMPGDIGPRLSGMKQRFPDKKQLRAQIWDPTVRNPETPMPPFGRHQILTEDEIDKVVEFIHSL